MSIVLVLFSSMLVHKAVYDQIYPHGHVCTTTTSFLVILLGLLKLTLTNASSDLIVTKLKLHFHVVKVHTIN